VHGRQGLGSFRLLSKNRDRFLHSDLAAAFFGRIREQTATAGLLSDEHFTVDGTLIEAWASLKSFRPKDTPPPDAGPDRNPRRAWQMLPNLEAALVKRVAVVVVTRPTKAYRDKDRPALEETLASLQDAGLCLLFKANIHQKCRHRPENRLAQYRPGIVERPWKSDQCLIAWMTKPSFFFLWYP